MSNNTIAVISDFMVKEEAAAAATIYPGMLLEKTSAGAFQAHSTAGGRATALFALENDLYGKDISDAYSATDRVQAGHFQRGSVVRALIADGESIVIGDYLESNGDGYLREVDADASVGAVVTGSVIGYAEEAISGTSAGTAIADERFNIRVV